MSTILKSDTALTFGDFRLTTIILPDGQKAIKIATDNGYLSIHPQSGNTVIARFTKP